MKTLSLRERLASFHSDERGLEVVQVVMIVAIAAVVLLVVLLFWGKIKEWANALLEELFGAGDDAKTI